MLEWACWTILFNFPCQPSKLSWCVVHRCQTCSTKVCHHYPTALSRNMWTSLSGQFHLRLPGLKTRRPQCCLWEQGGELYLFLSISSRYRLLWRILLSCQLYITPYCLGKVEKTSLGCDARKHFSDRVVDCGLKICYGTGRGQLEAKVVEFVV